MTMTALPTHPTLVHPLTGAPLQAIGLRRNGQPIWPIMGGSEDASTGQSTSQTGRQDGTDTGGTGSSQDAGQQNQQGQGTGQQGEPQDVAGLPRWAQDLIKGVRGEAAQHRTKAADLEKANQATLDAIAQAVGLKKADADPEKLATELAKVRDEKRAAHLQLAVFRMAGNKDIEADPAALLDSRSFLDSTAGLDPSEDGFADKVKAAIKDAVKANPKLKAAPPGPTRSGGDHPGGAGNTNTRPANLREAYARRNSG